MKFKAENNLFKGEELIRDVIMTSRNLHRYIRMQSADMKMTSQ